MGRHLSRSGDTGQCIPCFDSCQLIATLMCNQFSLSMGSQVARKCESKHWYACGADGRSEAVYGRVITKFCGMGRFNPWCSAGELRIYSPSDLVPRDGNE